MEFEELDFFAVKEEIEAEGVTDKEIEETAARLCGFVLESYDITATATLCLNLICQELLNIEQRQGAGYRPIHQQVMLGRWTNLLEFVLQRLQGVRVCIRVNCDLEDAAAKYFAKHERLQLPTAEAQAPAEAGQRAKTLQTAAARRLESPELQAVKEKLIQAGIIKGGKWQGTPAEFGCLVAELHEQHNVSSRGARAWKDVARWAGYEGNTESARGAIESNPSTRGPIADKIREICKAIK